MKLYLVQHAQAVPKEADPQRPLSEQGRRDAEKIAAFIKPLGLCVEYLWHSPKARAAQTAELLAKAVTINKSCVSRDGLGPNDDVSPIADELCRLGRDVMIVGHLPFLERLTSLLLTGCGSAGDMIAFKQGGIVALDAGEENKWQIEWMITPGLVG